MGKLLDKLEKASRGVVQPLGFGGAARREKIAPLLLMGAVHAGNESEAKLVAEAGLDAVIVIARDGAGPGDVKKSAGALGGLTFGVWYDQAQPQDAEGSDFQVFSSEATPLAALGGEERTNVMQVVPELDDSLLRTIELLPVDAFLVSLMDADSLNVAQLMRLGRVRGVTSRWLLVQLASLPNKDELAQLRDAGVGAIIVNAKGNTLDALKACKEELLQLPHETPERSKHHAFATLPTIGESRRPSQPEPEPEEDDWDDE